MSCISHQLNTAMRHVVDGNDLKGTDVHRLIQIVKAVDNLLKHAGLNSYLPSGSALKQEVSTRFGTTCDIIERFLKSYEELVNILNKKIRMLQRIY